MSAVPNKMPFDPGRAAYVTLNVVLLGFLLAPIAIVLVFAFNPTPYISFPPVGISLRWFDKFFGSADFMSALFLSLWVAACVLVLSVLIGGACSLALARGRLPGRAFLTAFFMSPLMLPAILTGLALFQSYLLAGIGRPVWGLIMAHTLVAVPYVLRTTLAVLHNFDRRIEEAAAVLGASPTRVFFEVTLPLIRPGVFAGGLFAVLISLDNLPISFFFGSSDTNTLPVVMLSYMENQFDPSIAAISTVQMLIAIVVLLIADRVYGIEKLTS